MNWAKDMAVVLALGVVVAANSACQHARGVEVRPAPDWRPSTPGWFRPTQVAVLAGWEIVVDYGSSRLHYRRAGSGEEWAQSPLELKHPHAIATGSDGAFYVADTDNHRIVRCTDLARPDSTSVDSIAGQPLDKPHDIVFEPSSGLLYVIDSSCRLTRFRSFGVAEAALQFDPLLLGYTRSLSVVDGKVYLIGSSKGLVVRVDSFEQGRFTVFTSPGKKQESPEGTWATTGLVLNDVERFAGWWYGSNFFLGRGSDYDSASRYSLLRWRTWADFVRGRWQDLGNLVESGVVPYYFWVAGDRLLLAGLRGTVYVLTPIPGRDSVRAEPVGPGQPLTAARPETAGR